MTSVCNVRLTGLRGWVCIKKVGGENTGQFLFVMVQQGSKIKQMWKLHDDTSPKKRTTSFLYMFLFIVHLHMKLPVVISDH